MSPNQDSAGTLINSVSSSPLGRTPDKSLPTIRVNQSSPAPQDLSVHGLRARSLFGTSSDRQVLENLLDNPASSPLGRTPVKAGGTSLLEVPSSSPCPLGHSVSSRVKTPVPPRRKPRRASMKRRAHSIQRKIIEFFPKKGRPSNVDKKSESTPWVESSDDSPGRIPTSPCGRIPLMKRRKRLRQSVSEIGEGLAKRRRIEDEGDRDRDSQETTKESGNGEAALPYFNGTKDALRRISAATLAGLLDGSRPNPFDDLVVLDCRYPYEFEGGHVKGAENINTPEKLMDRLYSGDLKTGEKTGIIFHCEFSSQRGPEMALLLRKKDRENNLENYPQLDFPQVYILADGYKNFHREYQNLCEPCGYVPMEDPACKALEKKETIARRNIIKRLVHCSPIPIMIFGRGLPGVPLRGP